MKETIRNYISREIAFIILLLTSPLIVISIVCLKIESPYLSAFYVQQRIGKSKKTFKIYKLRTMYPCSNEELEDLKNKNEVSGHMFKIKQDPRITPVGRYLRKFSLDELPQLINVLKGDMALVGPRPALPDEVENYSSHHLKRLTVLPGCTGLWQISGRSNVSFEEMIELDLMYIENISLFYDLKIIFLTIPAVLTTRGAY
ncbi:TPA: sugar transferase [Enterococcus faecalis]|nr:sugar transferase [Enterococcus faecalis]EKK0901665.1 sugar transferase [Enterococcus faecalis]EMC0706692.1 sugar transferase [Enterococcus faecalis]HBI1739142.1 sugar transferase [Enterococcus faecalis]HBI1741888.1 sugar transferase [Enterococcus faecalis]